MTTLAELIPILLDKTKARKLDWDKLGSNSFVARLGENAVEVAWGKDHAQIFMRNASGEIIERTGWADLADPEDDLLDELFGLAQRRALKADEALDDFKKRLDNL